MEDKPLFDIENKFEADLISEVLNDKGIPFRIVLSDDSYLGTILGEGATLLKGYGKLWGYVQDKEKIGKLIDQVRRAKPIENINDFSI